MLDEMLDDEDIEQLSGEDEEDLVITSGLQLDGLFDRVASKRTPDRQALRILSRAKFPESGSQFKPKMIAGLKRLQRISAGMAAAAGKIEADYLRRPNQHCGIYGANLAPATSATFTITPSGGQSWYRFLGIIFTKSMVEKIGFSSLLIGGLQHINAVQNQASPVTGAVPAAGFVVGDSSNVWNLSPWTGVVFDNATPITMVLVNMTTPGAGDAETVAPRCNLPVQTDPCGQGYQGVKATAGQWMKRYKRALASYHRGSLLG